jgi:uncharacterized membrane protein YebE (DUF533 family)
MMGQARRSLRWRSCGGRGSTALRIVGLLLSLSLIGYTVYAEWQEARTPPVMPRTRWA